MKIAALTLNTQREMGGSEIPEKALLLSLRYDKHSGAVSPGNRVCNTEADMSYNSVI